MWFDNFVFAPLICLNLGHIHYKFFNNMWVIQFECSVISTIMTRNPEYDTYNMRQFIQDFTFIQTNAFCCFWLLIKYFPKWYVRVRKTPSARQQCWPESFCESGKFLQQAHYLLKNFRIFWKMSGYYTKYPDNMQSRDELEIFHMM